MARYLGSRTKLSKRVGRNLFLKGVRNYSAKDDYSKRPQKPGVHGGKRGGKQSSLSEYGKQLLEKQILKYTYGLMEKQLSNIFKKSFKIKGDTGKIALGLLERRLDNVLYRAGMSNSRSQARQIVNHGHLLVNGVPTNIPSFVVKVGDIITVKESKLKGKFWTDFVLQVPNVVPTWLDTTKKHFIKVISLPLEEDLPQDIKTATIVEFYSRKVA